MSECTHVNPHRCREHGTSTRRLLITEAMTAGWLVTESPLADMFERDGQYLIKYWHESDPQWLGAGSAHFASADAKPSIDRTPLSIVNARRILGGLK